MQRAGDLRTRKAIMLRLQSFPFASLTPGVCFHVPRRAGRSGDVAVYMVVVVECHVFLVPSLSAGDPCQEDPRAWSNPTAVLTDNVANPHVV